MLCRLQVHDGAVCHMSREDGADGMEQPGLPRTKWWALYVLDGQPWIIHALSLWHIRLQSCGSNLWKEEVDIVPTFSEGLPLSHEDTVWRIKRFQSSQCAESWLWEVPWLLRSNLLRGMYCTWKCNTNFRFGLLLLQLTQVQCGSWTSKFLLNSEETL